MLQWKFIYLLKIILRCSAGQNAKHFYWHIKKCYWHIFIVDHWYDILTLIFFTYFLSNFQFCLRVDLHYMISPFLHFSPPKNVLIQSHFMRELRLCNVTISMSQKIVQTIFFIELKAKIRRRGGRPLISLVTMKNLA